MNPAVAHRDASSSIVLPLRMHGIGASALSGVPSIVFLGQRDSVPRIVSGCILSKEAPAACGVSTTKIAGNNDSFLTAIAHAAPRGAFPFIDPYSFEYGKSAKSGSCEINNPRH